MDGQLRPDEVFDMTVSFIRFTRLSHYYRNDIENVMESFLNGNGDFKHLEMKFNEALGDIRVRKRDYKDALDVAEEILERGDVSLSRYVEIPHLCTAGIGVAMEKKVVEARNERLLQAIQEIHGNIDKLQRREYECSEAIRFLEDLMKGAKV